MDLTFTLIGSGDSHGVPRVGNDWGDCDPNNIKNKRTRSCLMVESKKTRLIFDIGPDFRHQMIKHEIEHIDAVILTHGHYDHIGGLDDLRYYSLKQKHTMPIYMDNPTYTEVYKRASYLVDSYSDLYPAMIKPHIWTLNDLCQPQKIGDISFIPFEQDHGYIKSLGFRFGNIGYSTDFKTLPDTSIDVLKGIDIWIADAAAYQYKENVVHATIDHVIELNQHIGARQVYLHNLPFRMDYQTVNAETPDEYDCAYDGLVIKGQLHR